MPMYMLTGIYLYVITPAASSRIALKLSWPRRNHLYYVINPDMLKEIEAWANEEFRSTNGQIEYLLQQALLNGQAAKRKNNKDLNKVPEITKLASGLVSVLPAQCPL
jgi:hypothetical protein